MFLKLHSLRHDRIFIHHFLGACVQAGVTHVVMEVAAQALSLHRVEGIQFSAIGFTNFDQEHLEFYASMYEYFLANSSIFSFVIKTATHLQMLKM